MWQCVNRYPIGDFESVHAYTEERRYVQMTTYLFALLYDHQRRSLTKALASTRTNSDYLFKVTIDYSWTHLVWLIESDNIIIASSITSAMTCFLSHTGVSSPCCLFSLSLSLCLGLPVPLSFFFKPYTLPRVFSASLLPT